MATRRPPLPGRRLQLADFAPRAAFAGAVLSRVPQPPHGFLA